MRIINEPAVTTLAAADKLLKDNPSTGVAAIAWSDFMAQIQALFLTNGKLSSNLVPSSFAGGISYKGTVAGASVPASSGATGDYYLISSAGTSQAITWAVGDFAVWNGAAWQKVAMAGAYTTPTDVSYQTNPRAPRQGLVFDGTAGVTVAPFTLGTMWSIGGWVRPASSSGFRSLIISNSSNDGLYIADVTNLPYVRANSTDYNPTGVVACIVNKMAFVVAVFDGTSIIIYVNGLASSALAISNISGNISNIGRNQAGTNVFSGYFAPFTYNRALSATEIIMLYEAGAPASADYNNASNTSLITGDNSTFTSSLGSWLPYNGAVLTNPAANMVITGGAAVDVFGAVLSSPLTIGKRYRAIFTASVGAGTLTAYVDANGNNVSLSTTPTQFSLEFTATTAPLYIRWNNPDTSARAVTIDSVLVYPIGILLAPDSHQFGLGLTWNDQSGNGSHIVLPTAGVGWANPGGNSFHVRGTTNTNGNQQLLGATCLPATCQITRVRARARTNTPTITIGTASGGAQIVASVALSTTWKDLTIALTGGIVSSASSIWIGSNSTDVVEIDVTAEPLSF